MAITKLLAPPTSPLVANKLSALNEDNGTKLSSSNCNNSSNNIKSPTPSTGKRARDRRVSFAAQVKAYANTSWSAEDLAGVAWYTESEFRLLKEGTMAQAKQIYKKETGSTAKARKEVTYSSVLLRIYDVCNTIVELPTPDQDEPQPQLPQPKVDDSNNAAPVLSDKQRTVLAKFVGRASTRTGLERIFCRELSHDKKWRRQAVARAVLDVQARHKNTAASYNNSDNVAELVRTHSLAVSRTSRLFASAMGQALSTAMHQEEFNDV